MTKPRNIPWHCKHCGCEFHPSKLGRPPLYCTDSCRQRAYLKRNFVRR